MSQDRLGNYRNHRNRTLFKPAIALMNQLRYPQKFLLISVLFVLPLAMVSSLLFSEVNSRIEFTQKELYGIMYLRPLSHLWEYIPRRQIILQRQFYESSKRLGAISKLQTEQLSNIQNKIDQGITDLTNTSNRLQNVVPIKKELDSITLTWQSLRDSQEFLEFRNHNLLIEKINALRGQIIDRSNLILDPDLDTSYLIDAVSLSLPELQRLLHKIIQIEAEVKFKREVNDETKNLLISLISTLTNYNNDLFVNLERAFDNNVSGELRKDLFIPLRNFAIAISDFNTYASQLASQNIDGFVDEIFYQQGLDDTLADSFVLSEKMLDHLERFLVSRVQVFGFRKQIIFVVIICALIVITYLFIGFYLSVMRTVQQLDMASQQMQVGNQLNIGVINIDSRDELSMVIQSFNTVVIALKESEEKYRSIFENSISGIFQTTIDGKYINLNKTLAEIYGYESVQQMMDEVVNIQSQVYVNPQRRREFQEIIEKYDTITDFESEIYRRDRSKIWISENVRVLRDDQNRIICYEGTVEEITQRKLAEIALEEANQKIINLNQQLKEENLRMSSELDVTRRLQKMILPKDTELEMIRGLDIAGFMEPAAEVGGDYYDVLQQGGKIKIGIGDVTGHGLESGMLMIMVQTAVRALLETNENDPVRFLDILNRTIYGNVQRMDSDKNMTLSLIDYEQGKMTLSGQHEEIIVVRRDGTLERFDTIDLGFPIGLEKEISSFLDQKHVHLYQGDVMVLYTDGITEAENKQRQLYSVERLCEVICEYIHASASEIRDYVIADLRSHIGKHRIYDDITLLILKQK